MPRPDASDLQQAPEPRLSIGDVVERLRPEFPDVSPSMLRFFERERLVVPKRTPGGHRLYGAAEIERLRRLKRLQQNERLSLAEIRERLDATQPPAPRALTAAFLAAALAGRARDARALLTRAHDAGLSLRQLYESVLAPALAEVGHRWAAGELAVGQEHQVSAIARDAIADLSARHAPPANPRGVVVAACVPGERHDLGLRMVADLVTEQGYLVHFLGADVPLESILHALHRHRPDVLLLSVTLAEHVPALDTIQRAVAALPAPSRPRILVGGQASHGSFPADGLDTILQALHPA